MGSSREMGCMEFVQVLYISAWHSLHSLLLVMDGVSISKALKSMREAKGNAISAVIERKSNTDFLAIFPPLYFISPRFKSMMKQIFYEDQNGLFGSRRFLCPPVPQSDELPLVFHLIEPMYMIMASTSSSVISTLGIPSSSNS